MLLNSNPNLEGNPVLIGTHKIITQTMLNSVAPARAADLYGFSGITKERNLTLLAIGKLVLEFAKICNFTPIVVNLNDISSGKIKEKDYSGTIIPFVVPKIASKDFSPLVKTKASMSLAVYQYFNFVYCDIDRDLYGTDLRLLLRPFQTYCWLIILLNLIILPGFLNRKKYFVYFFSVLGALFSQIFVSSSQSRRKLLTLWIFACIVLNTAYSGVLTSLLISPAEKDIIKTPDVLAGRGYRLAYTERGFFKYVSFMVEQLVGPAGTHEGESSTRKKHPLKILTEGINFKSTLPEMTDTLAFEPKTSIFGPAGLIMQYWGILSRKNEDRNKHSRLRRKCHIGRDLTSAYAHPEVWIFKKGKKVTGLEFARVFNRFHANGIHVFWMDLFTQFQATTRAQDMNKFKSPTEIKEEVPVESLGFQNGSILVIFTIFGIMIIICWLGLVSEIAWHLLGYRRKLYSWEF